MRALIVGLGAVGQRHARNLRELRPGVELVAWRQRRRPGTITNALRYLPDADVEAELGITSFTDLDAALATRPDLAVICTPTSQHAATASRAAMAGCHLFIEKPVSHSLDGLARLHATVAERGLIAAVGSQWRFHPCVEHMRAQLWSAALGKVRRAEIDFSEYLPDWHPYEDYRESYAARAELGGGVVLTQIHDYDLASWLFGAARSVMATGGTHGSLEIDVEDTVQAQIDCAAASVVVRQTFAEPAKRRRIVVRADRGTITCDLVANTVSTDTGGGLELMDYDRNGMFRSVMEDFVHSVERRTAPRTGLADGIAVLKLALAVKESMRRHAPVSLA
jgi:predicted dehydrogenase